MERCQKLTPTQIQQLHNLIQTSKKADEVKRAQAIFMLDQEVDLTAITTLTGYQRRQVYLLRQQYLKEGIESLTDRRKGKPKELLTKSQRERIMATIKNTSPRNLGYLADFWTTGLLGEYIEHQYNVKYKSKTSYQLIFKKSDFSYHKPGRVYQLQNQEEVKKFRQQAEITLEKAKKEKDTIILCEDEMILSTQTTFQKIWLPKGEYPRVTVSNTRKNRSIYGFLNIKTGKEHAFKTEWQNMYITENILKELRKIYPNKKLLIFWDGAGWHRGSVVQKFIQYDSKIETVYFPRYSPEENSQEHVWKQSRSQVTHNRFIENIDTATDEFVKYLNSTKFPYQLLGLSASL